MYVFTDLEGERVELTFGANPYQMIPRHVLLMLKYEGKWLLTEHRTRGLEFPGGKAEEGESIETAVIRETYEETGVSVTNIKKFAEYIVHNEEPFCKAVFTGEVDAIEANPTLHETRGAVWLTEEQLDGCTDLSFHMQDEGMEQLKRWIDWNEKERNN